MTTQEEVKEKRKYWYFISEWYCPMCNRTTTYKERRYTPKPEKWEDRHEFTERYDYCSG